VKSGSQSGRDDHWALHDRVRPRPGHRRRGRRRRARTRHLV